MYDCIGVHHVVGRSVYLPNYVKRYCNDTKTRYMQQSVLPESEWPPSLGGQYIRLALISQGRLLSNHRYKDVIEQQRDYTRGDYDKILKYKTEIELTAAFDKVICEGGNELPLKMLIDGAPGVGKTTLSRKASRMWAEDELVPEYWLVLLLHLRESTISKAETVDEFFYHEDPLVQENIITCVKERSGDGVLIIFDGFDELSSRERSEQSLVLNICRGKILPKCAVVITSRPYASKSLQELPLINRHIEVLGFTEEQVKTCIRQKIKDEVKAEELCTDLKDRLDITSICQIPLNCSIVLYVYEQEEYSLPRTLTELYDLFVLHSLKRFTKRTQTTAAADRLLDLVNLRSPSTEDNLISLCKLAYKGLEEDKLVFSRNDVETIFPSEYQESSTDLSLLDLMTSAKSYSIRGAQDTYSFLHLTIQEFLGAYWIAHHSTDAKKLQFFQENLKENRFRMVLLFLSGMTKLGFLHAFSIFDQISWEEDIIHACHLLYESGNVPLYKCISDKYISPKTVKIKGSRFDALVVSHFIAYSNNQWDKLQLRPNDVTIVNKVFSSCTLNTSIQIVMVSFTRDDDFTLLKILERSVQIIGVSISLHFSEERKEQLSMLEKVRKILMGPHAITSKDYTIVLEYISGTFSVYRNDFLTQFCETLAEGLAQNSSITGVKLNCVSADDVQLIFTRLSKSNSISNLAHIQCIQNNRKSPVLNEQYDICKRFCASLETYISKNKSLQSADLDVPLDSHLIVNHIEVLKSGLAHNTTIQTLSICKGKVLFKRNQKTKKIELIEVPNPYTTPYLNPASPNMPVYGSSYGCRDFQTGNRLLTSPLTHNSPSTQYPMTPKSLQPVFFHGHSTSLVLSGGNRTQLLSPNHVLTGSLNSPSRLFLSNYEDNTTASQSLMYSAQHSLLPQGHAQFIQPQVNWTQSVSSLPAKRPCPSSLGTVHQAQTSIGMQHSPKRGYSTCTPTGPSPPPSVLGIQGSSNCIQYHQQQPINASLVHGGAMLVSPNYSGCVPGQISPSCTLLTVPCPLSDGTCFSIASLNPNFRQWYQGQIISPATSIHQQSASQQLQVVYSSSQPVSYSTHIPQPPTHS